MLGTGWRVQRSMGLCSPDSSAANVMLEQGRWVQASPPLAMRGGDQVQSKPLGDEDAVGGMGGHNISASPVLFARRGTQMTCLLF